MRELIRDKVQETKRRLVIEAVSKLFEEEGISALKMQDIARYLDMSVGALYKLFESKEALFYAYVTYQYALFHSKLTAGCTEQIGPRRCLERFAAMKLEVFRAKRKAVEDPMAGDPLFFLKMDTRIADAAAPIYDFLAEQFEKLAETTPLKEKDNLKIAYLFNAFTTGYVEYWISRGGELEESPEKVVGNFLEGMIGGER